MISVDAIRQAADAIRRAAAAPTRRTEASAPTVRAQAIVLERQTGRMRITEGQRTDRTQTREIAQEARIGRRPASAAASRTALARATCHAPATVRAAPVAASVAGVATTPFRASAQAARRSAAPTVDAPACKARATADLAAAAVCGPAAADAVGDARERRTVTSPRRFRRHVVMGAPPTVALACALGA